MRTTLTIAGLYNFDNTLFDNLVLPTDVVKDTAIFHIIEECGFLEIIFPNPEYMKQSIGEWSKGMLLGWTRYWNAINKTYEPLENYNMEESIIVDLDGTNTGTVTLDLDSTDTGTVTLDLDGTNTGDVTTSRAAFNSATMVDGEKRTDDLANTTDSTTTNDLAGTVDSTTTNDLAHTIDSTTTTNRAGNIGVTTSQQMLEAELEITRKLNFYRELARDFKERYCILIY